VTLAVRAIAVEQTRPLRHAVLRPHQDIAELAAHETDGAFAIGAYEGDELIAVGFIAPEDEGWRVRGMATAPQARGRGAGAAVLEALVAHATAQGAERIWANVRVPARAFYERAGFAAASEEFDVPDIGPHLVMQRRLTRQ
jgi:GNAT superfamily N-acetyltransferase